MSTMGNPTRMATNVQHRGAVLVPHSPRPVPRPLVHCHASSNFAASGTPGASIIPAASSTLAQPMTDTTSPMPRTTPPAPAQPTQPPQEKLTGAQVESRALSMAVDTHKQWLATSTGSGSMHAGVSRWTGEQMDAAYERCGFLTSEYAKTFYLGTQLMTPEKARAIWAIYVWCRRTDELVDGPNAARVTPAVLDRWEQRLEEVWVVLMGRCSCCGAGVLCMALLQMLWMCVHHLHPNPKKHPDICWAAVRHAGCSTRPHCPDVSSRHPIVPRHGGRHAHGSVQTPLQHL